MIRNSDLIVMHVFDRTMLLFCVGVVFIKAATGAIGIAMYAYYSDCDPILAGVSEFQLYAKWVL